MSDRTESESVIGCDRNQQHHDKFGEVKKCGDLTTLTKKLSSNGETGIHSLVLSQGTQLRDTV